jgi:hypothetical protein
MSNTNLIFSDLLEGKQKKTFVFPSINNSCPLKTISQYSFVSGMQVFNKTLNLGFPNLMLSGVIVVIQLTKIPHPVLLNLEPLTITLYLFFGCRSAQVRCMTISYKPPNKIDMYSFTNYIYSNHFFTIPAGLHLLAGGVPMQYC